MENRLLVAFWVVLFFPIGAAIAAAIGILLIEKGIPALIATIAGAGGGAVGAWLMFAAGIRLRHWLRNRPPATH